MARSAIIKVDGKTVDDSPAALEGEARENAILEASQGIIGRLHGEAMEQVRLKSQIEERWIRNLRQYYGKYTEATLKSLKGAARSQAFVKLTRHKTNGWAARLSDLLFPTDDRNWGIEPTPVPKLIKSAQEAVAAAKAGVDQANAAPDPDQAAMIAEQADAWAQRALQTGAEIEEAKKRCNSMQEEIEDQLLECNYASEARRSIEDGCRIGTGIIKGPLTSQRLRREWRSTTAGFYELTTLPDPMPEYRWINPWHFFPDMSAATIEEAEFTYERSLPTAKDLRRAALKFNFNKDAVRRLLKEGPNPLGTEIDHITSLRAITGEGEAIKDRYLMWEYNGSLECNEVITLLRAAGMREQAEAIEEEDDWLKEYRVIVYFCQNEVLKIAPEYPMDSGETLYSVWNFEKGETSIFGIGIPEIMSDSQRAANGAWRMMMDNSGLSVGPQIVIDKDQVKPQDGSYSIKALKVWLKTGSAMSTPQNPPFQVFNIPNNQQQLAGIIEIAKEFADEETSMPLIAQGEQGAATQTLGGMSMLFNSANVVFRRVVKSFDDQLTTPTLRRAYDWNMQHNPREDIKGDMQVNARGTSVLLVREIQSQNLLNIMQNWTVHPVIGAYVKVRDGLVKTLQTMMIDPNDLLFDQATAEKRQQQAAEAQAQQGSGTSPEELRLQIAQLDGENRLQVANIQRDIKLMELASRENMTLEQLKTQLQIKDIEHKSKERIFAAGAAIEADRASRAKAQGNSEEAAVGQGVG